MDVQKDNVKEGEEQSKSVVPDLYGMSINEAKKILKESGLEINTDAIENDENLKIKEQFPIAGVEVNSGAIIDVKVE